jgi:hypothetical protein
MTEKKRKIPQASLGVTMIVKRFAHFGVLLATLALPAWMAAKARRPVRLMQG